MTTSRGTSHTRRIRRGPIVSYFSQCRRPLPHGGKPHRAGTRCHASGNYGWPVKPFPTVSTRSEATPATRGRCSRGARRSRTCSAARAGSPSIWASTSAREDGTAVYAVRSGTANSSTTRQSESLRRTDRRRQYWHVVPAVRTGEHVVAYQTVIGHVTKAAHHVHLTELRDGQALNPLAPGHLTPSHADHTTPAVSAITVR